MEQPTITAAVAKLSPAAHCRTVRDSEFPARARPASSRCGAGGRRAPAVRPGSTRCGAGGRRAQAPAVRPGSTRCGAGGRRRGAQAPAVRPGDPPPAGRSRAGQCLTARQTNSLRLPSCAGRARTAALVAATAARSRVPHAPHCVHNSCPLRVDARAMAHLVDLMQRSCAAARRATAGGCACQPSLRLRVAYSSVTARPAL